MRNETATVSRCVFLSFRFWWITVEFHSFIITLSFSSSVILHLSFLFGFHFLCFAFCVDFTILVSRLCSFCPIYEKVPENLFSRLSFSCLLVVFCFIFGVFFFIFWFYFEIIVFTWVNCFHLLTLRCVLSSVCTNLSVVCSASRAVLTFLLSELDSVLCRTVFTVQFQPDRGDTFRTSPLYVTPETSNQF